jgi:hypothetical protein
MLYTLICNGMRKEVKSIWWDHRGECWIDISTNGPNGPLGPWLASGSETPSPLEGWWAPVTQHYKREWGPWAQTTRFAACTVNPTLLTLADPEGVLKWREAPLAPRHSTSTPTVAASVHIFTDEAVMDTTVEVKVCDLQSLSTRSTTSRSCNSIN